MHHIKSERGIKWHYAMQGKGEPLVFLHGWGVNMRIWRQQFKSFSKSYTTIMFDLPGHGGTAWEKMTLSDMAEDIKYILNELGVQRFNVVGSSFGGLVAIKLANMCPGRIKRMIFVGSTPKFARSDDYPYGLEVKRIRKLAGQLESDYQAMINIFFRSLFTKEERATRRFKWIQRFRKEDSIPDSKAALEILEILEKEDLRETLNQLDMPMQFIYGDEDHICPKEVYERLKKDFPHARFDIFEKTGHFPFLINNYEFNKVLGEFLQA